MTRILALAAVLLLVVGAVAVRPGPTPAAAPSDGSVVMPEPAAASGWSGADAVRYSWPTGGPVAVVRAFDAPEQRWSAGHRGVDLALAHGAEVRAAGDGRVAFAGLVAGRPVVAIVHADGLRTTYEPVTPAVAAGADVAGGQVIGHLAAPTHCDPATCLHWGARRAPDVYVDPMLLLDDRRVRLYPDRLGRRARHRRVPRAPPSAEAPSGAVAPVAVAPVAGTAGCGAPRGEVARGDVDDRAGMTASGMTAPG